MDHLGVAGRQAARNRRLSSRGHEHISASVGQQLAGYGILGDDAERGDGAVHGQHVVPCYAQDLGAVSDDVIEEAGAPAQVFLVLGPGWQKSAQVGELDEPTLLVQVVEEGEVGTRIAERGQVLEEGYLHFGAGQQHAGVPGETGLLLQEQDAWRLVEGAGRERIVQGHGDSQAGRAKTDTDQIVDGVRVGRREA